MGENSARENKEIEFSFLCEMCVNAVENQKKLLFFRENML